MGLSLQDGLSERGIEKWIRELGVTDALVPRRNIKTALQFFAEYMPKLSPEMAASFLRAMDLSRRVSHIVLTPGERLIAFRLGRENPFKLFFTRSGASPFASGINPAGRSAVSFEVRAPAHVLESFTTGTVDFWTLPGDDQHLALAPRANTTGVMVAGGGIQLIVPNSVAVLTWLPQSKPAA